MEKIEQLERVMAEIKSICERENLCAAILIANQEGGHSDIVVSDWVSIKAKGEKLVLTVKRGDEIGLTMDFLESLQEMCEGNHKMACAMQREIIRVARPVRQNSENDSDGLN